MGRTSTAVEIAYDRLIRFGHVDRLTLFGYFPALVYADVWLVFSRARPSSNGTLEHALLVVALICLTFGFLYGFVALFIARRFARDALLGSLPFTITAAIVMAGYILNTVYYILVHRGLSPTSGIEHNLSGVILIAEICILSPVSEELAWQGFVQTRLLRFGVVTALFVTTTLFVCVHLTEIPGRPDIADIAHIFLAFFPTLLIYALVRQITGSLLAAIVLHAIDNTTIILFLAK